MLFRRSLLLGWRLTVATVLSVVLMFCDQRSISLARVHFGLDTLVAPLQLLVASPTKMVSWAESSFTTQQALIADNTRLQAQLLLQQGQLQKLYALEQENQQLRALLHASSIIPSKVTIAKVLALASDPFTDELILDQGARNGVYEGQSVLDANGVMGQIIRVGELTSRVMVLADIRSAVPVQDARTGVRGVVIGTGTQRLLAMINVPTTADVKVGDQLMTSGLDLRFPAGYPVGRIYAIHRNPGQHFAKIHVIADAAIDKSQSVLLVWQNAPEQVKEAKAELKNVSKDKQQDALLRNTLSNTNL